MRTLAVRITDDLRAQLDVIAQLNDRSVTDKPSSNTSSSSTKRWWAMRSTARSPNYSRPNMASAPAKLASQSRIQLTKPSPI
jgi:uncharacterized membrane protein